MNTENKILIQSLEEGYVVTDCISGKKYAVESPEGVVRIISKALGIPEPEPKSEESKHQKEEMDGIEQLSPVPNILKQDILIQKFEYDHSLRKSIPDYKNIWVAELTDGRVALGYGESSYYTTKEKVMKIRYPVPYGYFKGSGVSTVALTCLRAYRNLLSNLLSADKSLTKNENDAEGNEPAEEQVSDYVSKSTQDRIRESAECKTKTQKVKGEIEQKKKEKTRALREMVTKMGIQ